MRASGQGTSSDDHGMRRLPGEGSQITAGEVFGDETIRFMESIEYVFRSVIGLADIEGLSYVEIANTVDCPMGAVRFRLQGVGDS